MAENTKRQLPVSSDDANASKGDPNVEDILKNAQSGMETISALIETARAAATATSESQRLTAAALTDAQTKLAEITAAATQAVAAKTRIVDDQAVIATKSDHIQKAQEHADKVRADLDRALTAATQQATEAEAQMSRTKSASDGLLEEIRKTKEFGDAAKATVTEAAESQRLAAIALGEAQTKLIETATQAAAAKTQISDAQAVIATKSDHIQKAQEHADKVRADLDRLLTAATQQATEAEGQKTRGQSAADDAAKLVADIRTTKGAVETDAVAIVTARKTAGRILGTPSILFGTLVAVGHENDCRVSACSVNQANAIEDDATLLVRGRARRQSSCGTQEDRRGYCASFKPAMWASTSAELAHP